MAEQIIDTFVPEISGLQNTVDTVDPLKVTTNAGVVYVNGRKTSVQTFSFSYPNNKDTYDDVSTTGVITHTSVDNSALEPPRSQNTTRLQKVVAQDGVIVSVTKLVPHEWDRLTHVAGRAHQSREVNEQTSLLEYAIGQLGNSIYKDGDIVEGCQLTVTHDGTVATITDGRMYIGGKVRIVKGSTLTLTGVGDEVIGVNLVYSYITEDDDKFLRDPATGYDGAGLEGAYRQKVEVVWVAGEDAVVGPDSAVVYQLTDGSPVNQRPPGIYTDIESMLSRRTWLGHGHFKVEGLDGSIAAIDGDDTNMRLTISSGVAFVMGHEIQKRTSTDLLWRKAVDTESVSESTTFKPNSGTDEVYIVGQPAVAGVDAVDAIYQTALMRVVRTTSLTENLPQLSIVNGGSDPGTVYQNIAARTANNVEIRLYSSIPANPGVAVSYTEGTDWVRGSGDTIVWQPGASNPGAGQNYYAYWYYHSDNGQAQAASIKGTRLLKMVASDSVYTSAWKGSLSDVSAAEQRTFTLSTSQFETTTDLVNSDIVDILTVRGDTQGNGGNPALKEYVRGVDWEMDTGRTDTAIGVGKIRWLRPTVNAPANGSKIVVQYRYWSHSTGLWNTTLPEGDYVSVDSYLERDDTNGKLTFTGQPGKYRIAYELVGSYGSSLQTPTTDVDLRNAVDFRPSGGSVRNPVSGTSLTFTYRTFRPRMDIVVLQEDGQLEILYGDPSALPRFPAVPQESLSLLSISSRPNSTSPTIRTNSIDRLTMQDLQFMRKRIADLEILTSTALLQKDAEGAVDSANLRGIYTDPFREFSRSDTHYSYVVKALDPGLTSAARPSPGTAANGFDPNGRGPWAATTVYAVDDVIKPTSDNGSYFVCIAVVSDAKSGGVEPTWNNNFGGTASIPRSTFTDGNVTWRQYDKFETVFYSAGMDIGSETVSLPMFYREVDDLMDQIDTANSSVYVADSTEGGQAILLPFTEVSTIQQRFATWPVYMNTIPTYEDRRYVRLGTAVDYWVDTTRDPAMHIEFEGETDYAFVTSTLHKKGGQIVDAIANLPHRCLRGRLVGWHRLFHIGTPMEFLRNPIKRSPQRHTIVDAKGRILSVWDPDNPDWNPIQGGTGFTPIEMTVTKLDNSKQFGDNVISTDIIPYMRRRTVVVHGELWTPNQDIKAIFQGKNVNLTIDPSGPGTDSPTAPGVAVRCDADGSFKASFTIPAQSPAGSANVRIYSDPPTSPTIFGEGETDVAYLAQSHTIHMRNSPGNVYSYPHDEAKPVGAIAQTTQYNIPRWLTGVDLFFASKHATRGVIVEVRNVTTDGTPGSTVLTSKYVPSSEINVDPYVGASATKVTFIDPVWVRSDEPFAIVVQVDSTGYKMWVADSGSTDLATGAPVAGGNLARGTMYYSENAISWQATQFADLKYNLYSAKFSSSSGVLRFNTQKKFIGHGVILTGTDFKPTLTNTRVSFSTDDGATWIKSHLSREALMSSVAKQIKVRIFLTQTSGDVWSPCINRQSIGLIGFTYSGVKDLKDPNKLVADYISDNYPLDPAVIGEIDYMKYITDESKPTGTDIEWYMSPDDGVSWRKFPNSGSDGFGSFVEAQMGDNKIYQRTRQIQFTNTIGNHPAVTAGLSQQDLGNSVPAAGSVYYVHVTRVNDVGESKGTTSGSITVTGTNDTIRIAGTSLDKNGADRLRIYVGLSTSNTALYLYGETSDDVANFDIKFIPNAGPNPPTVSTIDSGPNRFRVRCRVSSTNTTNMIDDPTSFSNAWLTQAASGGSLTNGTTYYFVYTLENSYVDSFGNTVIGETKFSPQASITMSGGGNNQKITVTLPSAPSVLNANATRANIYAGTTNGKAWRKVGTIEAAATTLVVTTLANVTSDAPYHNTTGLFSPVSAQVAKLRAILHDDPLI